MINKLFVMTLIGVFVSLAFASAVKLPPQIAIGASPNPANLTSAITAIGIDLSGSGINYVRIYENGVKVKECSSATCVFVAVHTTPGIRAYYATTADNTGGTAISSTMNLNFQNSAPVLNVIGTQTVNEGSLLTFTISGYDYNGDALTYSAITPIGSIFNTVTGVFSWTPAYSEAGIYNATFIVSDGSLSDSETVQINVLDVPTSDTEAPVWSSLTENPASGVEYSPSQIYEFNSTWNDNFAVNSVWIDFDGVNYTASGAGNMYNSSVLGLAAGTHSYEWFANDTSGNVNSTGILTYTVNKAVPPIGIDLSPSDSVANGTQTNVTGVDCPLGLICTLYRDGIAIVGSNSDIATFAAGTYHYVYNTTGNENYTSHSVSATLTVGAGGTSSEDGGTSGGSVKTVNSEDLAKGYYISMNVNDKLKFIFCGSPYYIKLTEADNDDDKATFMVTPVTNGFVLKEGISEKIDLDSDSVDDILFRLESVSTNKAKVYIKKISNLCVGASISANLTGNVEKLLPREEKSNLAPVAGFLAFGIVLSALGIIIKYLGRKR